MEIWQTPTSPGTKIEGQLELAPFIRYRSLAGHHDEVQSVEWSSDSRFFLTTSQDLTARIWHVNPEQGFVPTVLAGHRDGVIAAWFTSDQESVSSIHINMLGLANSRATQIYSVSRDGALFQWEYIEQQHENVNEPHHRSSDESQRWCITRRHFFLQNNAKVTCSAYHLALDFLVVGFSTGVFCLYELPNCSVIHTLR